jgi:hypothetical protein
MKAGTICVVLVTPLPDGILILVWRVRECLILADKVDDIHAETISSFIEPEANNIMNCLSYVGVLPVQIRLLGGV